MKRFLIYLIVLITCFSCYLDPSEIDLEVGEVTLEIDGVEMALENLTYKVRYFDEEYGCSKRFELLIQGEILDGIKCSFYWYDDKYYYQGCFKYQTYVYSKKVIGNYSYGIIKGGIIKDFDTKILLCIYELGSVYDNLTTKSVFLRARLPFEHLEYVSEEGI